MQITPTYIAVASNINVVAGTAAKITAGTLKLRDIPEGEAYIINQDLKVVVSAAIAATTKKFKICTAINGKEVSGSWIDMDTVSDIRAVRPQVFKGNRIVIGKFTGVTVTSPSIVPETSYSINFKIAGDAIALTNDVYFRGAATSRATGEIVGPLMVALAKSVYAHRVSRDLSAQLFKVVAHTNAAASGLDLTMIASEGDDMISYSAGVPLVGEYFAHQLTSAIDSRIQPRVVYRVEYVDSVNKLVRLSQPWEGASFAGDIERVLMADTDDWSLIIEAKEYISTDEVFPRLYSNVIQFMVNEDVSKWLPEDIYFQGTNIEGCQSVGHPINAEFNQVSNQAKSNNVIYRNTINKADMYSAISIEQTVLARGTALKAHPVLGANTVLIERGTIAATGAGTPVTNLTNLFSGTGIEDDAQGGLINSLNMLGKVIGTFSGTLNTESNRGGSLKTGLDY